MRLGTCLTQGEVISFESRRFVLENGFALEVPPVALVSDVSLGKDCATIDVTSCEVPKDTYVFLPNISL